MTSFAQVLMHNSDPAYASENRRTVEAEVRVDVDSAMWKGTVLGAPAPRIPARFEAGEPVGLRLSGYPPTLASGRLASEGSEYPASVVGRRDGCIRD